jgi:transposase-like protein
MDLPCWESVKKEDPLEDRVIEQMLVGISSRQYGRSLESLGEEMKSVTTSRSGVSRRLVARTGRQVQDFQSRPLGELDLLVILLDGTWFGQHMLLTALGIDSTGKKHVLGVVEGTTENEEVCRDLFRSLIGRGLQVERARLFVIDGARGSAVRSGRCSEAGRLFRGARSTSSATSPGTCRRGCRGG